MPRPPAAVQARAFEAEAQGLIAHQAKLYWRAWAFGEPARLAATYHGHQALFSKASIEVVARARAEAKDPARRLALRDLQDYLMGEHLARALAPVSRKIAQVEASALLHVGGDDIPYRDLGRLLASETDPAERRQLYDAAGPVVDELAPLLAEKAKVTARVVKDLGYEGTLPFAAELRQADAYRLAKQAKDLLARTRDVYRASLDRVATRRLGYGRDKLTRADVPRLFRTASLDTAFPAKRVVPRMVATLKAMGLRSDGGGHIEVDTKARPRKTPRPVCFPVAVPGDVRLSVKAVGGAADQSALLHEMGRAQAYAHVTSDVFAFQQLGGGATTEAWGMLFSGLMANPGWLKSLGGLTATEVAHLSEVETLQRLFLVRRFAGRLLFEFDLAQGKLAPGQTPARLYGEVMGDAYQFALGAADRKRWALDQDPLLAGADMLRAWFLAADVEDWLARKVGPSWYADTRTGPLLTGLWAEGTRLSPDDLSARVGAGRLSPDALIRTLEARLSPTAGAPTSAAAALPNG